MDEEPQLRIHGNVALPTLIYLPGLHGDWTLIGGFRHAIGGQVRFVELTYPRTLTWSLDDYAAAVETALAKNGITDGWLLGESFSSQVVWAMVARGKFRAQGVILAGGFVKYPLHRVVCLAEKITGRISTRLLVWIIFGYARVARFRYRHSPQILASIDEFISRRTELDRRAAQHRLHLMAENDPRPVARQTTLPVFGLSGVSSIPSCRGRGFGAGSGKIARPCATTGSFCRPTTMSSAPPRTRQRGRCWLDQSFMIYD